MQVSKDARAGRQYIIRVEVALGANQSPPERTKVPFPIVLRQRNRADRVMLAAQVTGELEKFPIAGDHRVNYGGVVGRGAQDVEQEEDVLVRDRSEERRVGKESG